MGFFFPTLELLSAEAMAEQCLLGREVKFGVSTALSGRTLSPVRVKQCLEKTRVCVNLDQ